MVTSVAEVAFRCLQLEKEMRRTMDEGLEALKDIKSENTGKGIDNVGVSTTARAPSSPQSDNVVLLKKIKSLSSPDSVTNRWVSSSTTSISKIGAGVNYAIPVEKYWKWLLDCHGFTVTMGSMGIV
ncbi:hypothetical protein ACSBR2_035897 [Camellia fascicularis]